MDNRKEAAAIIKELQTSACYAECPCCCEEIPLKQAALFFNDSFSPEAEAIYEQKLQDIKNKRKALLKLKKDIISRSQKGAKAVNIGFISEKIAPALKTFQFHQADCRSLFDPIDYIIFEGLHEFQKVSRILFTDIKTGNARLNDRQKQIKALIEKKKLSLDIYRGGKR